MDENTLPSPSPSPSRMDTSDNQRESEEQLHGSLQSAEIMDTTGTSAPNNMEYEHEHEHEHERLSEHDSDSEYVDDDDDDDSDSDSDNDEYSDAPEAPAAADQEDDEIKMNTEYGCKHYKRRCLLFAPCCNAYFPCRHCHNEAKTHELDRHKVPKVKCTTCGLEQPPVQTCGQCNTTMGAYFCEVCRFYEDDTDKKQFHCNECGICRIGGKENFFHCNCCGSCFNVELRGKHKCIEKSMHQNCPVCLEFLFTSRRAVHVLNCGHTIHTGCLKMLLKQRYTCPLCSKSIVDMTNYWKSIDTEIAAVPMPEEYRNVKLAILCNDCNGKCETPFHVLGLRCSHCGGYNTRQIKKEDCAAPSRLHPPSESEAMI